MLSTIYKKTIIDYPKIALALIILLLSFSLYFSKNFKLDASSDALLLEGDKDLKYLREVKTWGINEAKWKAAEAFCKDRDWSFKIITEKDLTKY